MTEKIGAKILFRAKKKETVLKESVYGTLLLMLIREIQVLELALLNGLILVPDNRMYVLGCCNGVRGSVNYWSGMVILVIQLKKCIEFKI